MSLTKSRLIDSVMAETGYSRNRSTELVEALLEAMKQALESGDDVLISGFGKFCVRAKEERRGRNPATGEEMIIAPRRVVSFRCSGQLREKING
jgi:integration host factor subunit alpha